MFNALFEVYYCCGRTSNEPAKLQVCIFPSRWTQERQRDNCPPDVSINYLSILHHNSALIWLSDFVTFYSHLFSQLQPRTQDCLWASVSVLVSEDCSGTGVVFDGESDFIAMKFRMVVRVWFRFIAISICWHENLVPSARCRTGPLTVIVRKCS